MDGKFDITGANQEGNGKIDGATVNFDIDPSKQSWKRNSQDTDQVGMKVRSHLCPPIPNGKAIYNTGKVENFGRKEFGRTIRNLVTKQRSMILCRSG